MYGLIVKLTSAPGRREELIDLMGGEDSHAVTGADTLIAAFEKIATTHPVKRSSHPIHHEA